MLLLDDERWLDNKLNISYQTDTDLRALEVADDDMICDAGSRTSKCRMYLVIQKEKRIEILLVWSDIMLTTNWTYHIKQRQTYRL